MKAMHMTAFILLIVGGLNWLLFGLFGKDLFGMLGMDMGSMIPKVVYILVGLSAIWEMVTHKSTCKMCGMKSAMPGAGMSGM